MLQLDAETRRIIHEKTPCRMCCHMALTYDNQRPYACQKFGFQSTNSPNLEVYCSTGMICAGYTPRPRPNR